MKIREWKKITEALKAGPDFGIHGCKYSNLRAILQVEGWVTGHYFAVGQEQKKLGNEEFYQKLWDSVFSALGYSTSFEHKDGKIKVGNLPCLLIGVDKRQNGERGIVPDASPRCSLHGDTFPIGHDFILSMIDVLPYWMTAQAIERLSKKVEKVSAEREYSLSIDKSFLTAHELVGKIITGIDRAVEGYQRIRSNQPGNK